MSTTATVKALVRALEAPDLDALDGLMPALLALMEAARGGGGWEDPRVTRPATTAELARLRDALLAHARAAQGESAGAAIFALGKLFDPSLEDFFIAELHRHLERLDAAHHALGQCLIALDNLEVPVLREGRFAAHELEANVESARSFLRGRKG